jgi:dihydroorotate dehydrogenase (fumarate)
MILLAMLQAKSASGGILAKSATVAAQTGNPLPRTWHAPDNKASMNSEGLPNNGIDYYLEDSTIAETFQDCDTTDSHNKPYMVSISGKTLKDNLEMLDKIAAKTAGPNSRIAGVELNLACPNVIGKPIIGYDFDQLRDILETLHNKKYPNLVLGLKLPPYLDRKHLQQAAEIINEYHSLVGYVASINTIGNALAVDEVSEAPFISSNNGLAGLSGPAVKYTALANVRQLRNHLHPSIDVVGVGGIETGSDAFLFLLCGAAAVQVGTCHWKEGPKCFDRICDELKQVMADKGYKTIDEFRGKVKAWSKEGAALTRAASSKGKEHETSAASQSTASTGGRTDFSTILNLALVVVIAILLADKYGMLEVPSE